MLSSSLARVRQSVSGLVPPTTRTLSYTKFNTPHSAAPYIEKYRPSWPDSDFDHVDASKLPPLPKRTVPDHLFQFKYRTRSHRGTAQFYKHFLTNPADLRVKCEFYLKDMPLNDAEKKVFVGLLGPRYNVGNQKFKLTCELFTNRIENCKYLMYLLETLLAEARTLAKTHEKELVPPKRNMEETASK